MVLKIENARGVTGKPKQLSPGPGKVTSKSFEKLGNFG